MVAFVTGRKSLSRFRSFLFLHSMFDSKFGLELTCVFAAVCLLMSRSAATDDPDFMVEFLKKEFSLAKPYRGKFSWQPLFAAVAGQTG